MLFEKKMEPRCAYCVRSSELDEQHIVCPRKGVMSLGGHCRAFRYDPLKRVPVKPAALELSRLKDEDFSL